MAPAAIRFLGEPGRPEKLLAANVRELAAHEAVSLNKLADLPSWT